MATQPKTGLTYEDLQAFPDDNLLLGPLPD
jgi:hypothetical protein